MTALHWHSTTCTQGIAGTPAPPALCTAPPRQRAKLWDLSGSVHCSIIGTCLTTAELRRAMAKFAKADIAHLSDHDLHAEAVSLCGHHNPCSKLLNKALEQRHQITIRQFARLHGEPAVMQRWREARQAGDIPGAYWAVLTHPDVGAPGIREAFGEVHMLSHLIGSANRADVKRLAVLEAEKAALEDKVARQQQRLLEAASMRDAALRRLGALAAGHDAAVGDRADPDAERDALRQLAASLQKRLDSETARRERLEARCAAQEAGRQALAKRTDAAEAECQALLRELAALERPADHATAPTLPGERILYVGGRPGAVEQMRDALAKAGGELLSHDGGRHDSPAQLPGMIGRAHRVVFPIDCVSHDAALTVKRICRQLGKPFLPLRSSGLASFLSAVTT